MKISNETEGFSLVEIVIVLAFISILSSLGIAGFVKYSQSQKLIAAQLDVATMLQTAKSRALSQVKTGTGSCSLNALDGYQVIFTTTTYAQEAQCGGILDSTTLQTKVLPSVISFTAFPINSFIFNVLTGKVTNASDTGTAVTLSSTENSSSKTITVYSNGRIVIN